MATVVRRKTATHTRPTPPVADGRPPRGRWKRRLVVLAIMALVCVGAAPWLIGHSFLRDALLSYALSDLKGSVSTGDASLGWFSPIAVSELEIRDVQGQTVLAVPEMSGERTLLGLLCQPSNLGRVRIERPTINLVLDDDGSNVEEVFAKMLHGDDESGGGIDATIEIVDATLTVRDATTNRQFRVEPVAASLTMPKDPSDPLLASLTGTVAGNAGPGSLNVKFTNRQMPQEGGRTVAVGQVVVKCDHLPLTMCEAVLRRAVTGCRASGELQTDLTCDWGVDQAGQTRQAIAGQMSVAGLDLAAPFLGDDRLRLNQLDVPCQVSYEAGGLRIAKLAVNCDLGQLTCQGTIPDPGKLADAPWKDVLTQIARGSAEVGGQVDLARAAQSLPNLLRVRAGTEISSGLMTMQLAGRPQGAETLWQGRVEMSRLAATHQGQLLSWEKPLLVSLSARDGQAGLTVDQLQCVSDFLSLEGGGTLNAGGLAGKCDLNRLLAELSKFIDLGELRLAGQGTTRLGWKRQADGRFEAGGELQIAGFECTLPGSPAWTEQNLTINVNCTGALDDAYQLRQLAAGQFMLVSGGDQLTATLRQPVTALNVNTVVPLDVQLQGQLASWSRRLSPWIGLPADLELSGQATLQAPLRWTSASLELDPAQLVVQPAKIHGHGLFIDEPGMRLTGSGRWVWSPGRLEVRELVLESSAVAVQARDTTLSWTEGGMQLGGKWSVDGDVARLQRWFADPLQASSWQLQGKLVGRGAMTRSGNRTTAELDAELQNLLATPRTGRQWSEPSVKLAAQAAYDAAADKLEVRQLDFSSDMLSVQAEGEIAEASAARNVQVDGKLNYDLDKLARLVQPYLGNGVQLSGRESRSFALAGPLGSLAANTPPNQPPVWTRQLTGQADLGWQWANLYGFRLGKGDLQTRLADGIFQVLPTDVAVGQGSLHLAPQVRFGPGPATLWLPAGKFVEQVEVSPEICARGLMYVLPVLADVTETRGKFSISLDGARVPLTDPTTGDLGGRLTLHSVEVGPGPLVQELASLLGPAQSVRLAQESEVQFRMVQGRVYHQGLTLHFPGGIVAHTRGSVGFDQTLAMEVEMPLPPKWIGNTPLAAGMKDRTIRLPIGGTLSAPRIDPRALAQLMSESARETVGGAVQSELNRGLERLFSPKK